MEEWCFAFPKDLAWLLVLSCQTSPGYNSTEWYLVQWNTLVFVLFSLGYHSHLYTPAKNKTIGDLKCRGQTLWSQHGPCTWATASPSFKHVGCLGFLSKHCSIFLSRCSRGIDFLSSRSPKYWANCKMILRKRVYVKTQANRKKQKKNPNSAQACAQIEAKWHGSSTDRS